MQRSKLLLSLLAIVTGFAVPAFAEGLVTITAPAVYESAGRTGAAFMTITNNSDKAVKFVKAQSDAAEKTELHTVTKNDNEVMQMRPVENLEIAPHSTLTLVPHGDHIMMIDLKKPLKLGDMIKLTLTFEAANNVIETQDVTTTVETRTHTPETGADDHTHHH